MFVGVSPLLSVFILEVTAIIFLFLLIFFYVFRFTLSVGRYVYVGVSSFIPVLLLEATIIVVYLLRTDFSAFSRRPLPIACLHFVKSFQLSCLSILLLPYGLPSTYREFVNSPFVLFSDSLSTTYIFRLPSYCYKTCASLWEGIIALHTLLLFLLLFTFLCCIPAALLSIPIDASYLCIGLSPWQFF